MRTRLNCHTSIIKRVDEDPVLFIECVIAFYMLRRGAIWTFGPTLNAEEVKFYWRLSEYFELTTWGIILMIVGSLHFLAIAINGRMKVTPVVRAVALLPSMIIFILLAGTFIEAGTSGGFNGGGNELLFAACAFFAFTRLFYRILNRMRDRNQAVK